MSIVQKEVDNEGFKAKIATIYCDVSGLKMAEIIVRDCEKKFLVQAKWHDEKYIASSPQQIKGCLSCSPIDSATQKTAIVNTEFENGDPPLMTVIVRKIK